MKELDRIHYSIPPNRALEAFLEGQEIRREYPEPISAPFIPVAGETQSMGLSGAVITGSFNAKGDENSPVYILEVSGHPHVKGRWWLIRGKKMRLIPAV